MSISRRMARSALAATLLAGTVATPSQGATDTVDYPAAGRGSDAVDLGAELQSRRTENSRTFKDSGGRLITRIYPQPVNYRDPQDGRWKRIDSRFAAPDRDGYIRPRSAGGEVAVPSYAGQPLRLGHEDRTATLKLLGARKTARLVERNSASFEDVFPGVSAEYSARPTGIKEVLTLQSPDAQRQFEYELRSEADLVARVEHGEVVLRAPGGEEQFRLSAPLAWDSGKEASYSDQIELSVRAAGPGVWKVTVEPDAKWLNDPSRVYPVHVDPDFYWVAPDVTRFHGATDCYFASLDQANRSFCATSTLQTGYYNRSYKAAFRFDVQSAIPADAQIQDATLLAFQPGTGTKLTAQHRVRTLTSAWDATSTWNSRKTGTPWATGGGDVSSDPALVGPPTAVNNPNYWYYWDAPLAAVRGWVAGSLPNNGFQLSTDAGSPGTTAYNWVSTEGDPALWPALDVKWSVPTPPASSDLGPIGAQQGSRFVTGSFDPPADTEQGIAEEQSQMALEALSDFNIDVVTGNLLIKGPEKDGRSTFYNSFAGATVDFGDGWRSTDGTSVRLEAIAGGKLLFIDATGARHEFTPSAGGFSAPATFAGTLAATSSGGYRVTETSASGRWYEFAGTGASATRSGDRDSTPALITYGATGSLLELQRPDGRVHSFSRGASGTIAAVSATAQDDEDRTYTYSNGRLSSTSAAGKSYTYAYDSSGRLVGVLSPAGNQTTFGYNSGTRKIASVTVYAGTARASTATFTYTSNSTTVTSPGLPSTTYNVGGGAVTSTQTPTVNASAPAISLSGSLWDARTNGLGSTDTYELAVAAPTTTSGDPVTQVVVYLDGEPVEDFTRDCQSGCSAPLEHTFTFDKRAFVDGITRVRVAASVSTDAYADREFAVARPAESVPPIAAPTQPSQTVRYARATDFRTRFGLDASPATVASADASPAAQAALYRWGAPLSPAETDRMEARVGLERETFHIDAAVTEHDLQDVFAGSYVDDTPSGSVVRVGFTSNVAANVATIQSEFPQPSKIVGFQATYSERDLEHAVGDVRVAARSGTPELAGAVSWGPSVIDNRVTLQLTSVTPTIEAAVANKFGGIVKAEEGQVGTSMARDEYRRQRQGGDLITFQELIAGEGPGPDCTLGFAGEHDPRRILVDPGWSLTRILKRPIIDQGGGVLEYTTYWHRVMTSAAHCTYIDTDDVFFDEGAWNQGNRAFGHGIASVLSHSYGQQEDDREGYRSDALAIKPWSRSFWGTSLNLGDSGFVPVTAKRLDGATKENDSVCHAGAVTAVDIADYPVCGRVTAIHDRYVYRFTPSSPNPLNPGFRWMYLQNGFEMNGECIGGDSGGPVFSFEGSYSRGAVAEGIVAAGEDSKENCVFGSAEGLEEEMRDEGLDQFHIAGKSPRTTEGNLAGQWVPALADDPERVDFDRISCKTPSWAHWSYRDENGRCHGVS